MQSMGDCAFLRFLLDLGVFDAEFDLALFPYVLNYHYQFCLFEPGSSELRATVRPSELHQAQSKARRVRDFLSQLTIRRQLQEEVPGPDHK
jgi:hypothetical protein